MSDTLIALRISVREIRLVPVVRLDNIQNSPGTIELKVAHAPGAAITFTEVIAEVTQSEFGLLVPKCGDPSYKPIRCYGADRIWRNKLRPSGRDDLQVLHQKNNYSQHSTDKEKVPGFHTQAKKEKRERNVGLRKAGVAKTSRKTQTV
jgi:hypothetical protein